MDTTLTWHDARTVDPRDGDLVLAAITGRYPADPGESASPEQDYWLVLPMHFRAMHPVEDTDQVLRDRYIDADHVLRRSYRSDGDRDEQVTHWAALPTLPGVPVAEVTGATVARLVAASLGA